MREMSVAEQRFKAVLAVVGDGRTVTDVARDWGQIKAVEQLGRLACGMPGLGCRA
jgi:hypothetical protein